MTLSKFKKINKIKPSDFSGRPLKCSLWGFVPAAHKMAPGGLGAPGPLLATPWVPSWGGRRPLATGELVTYLPLLWRGPGHPRQSQWRTVQNSDVSEPAATAHKSLRLRVPPGTWGGAVAAGGLSGHRLELSLRAGWVSCVRVELEVQCVKVKGLLNERHQNERFGGRCQDHSFFSQPYFGSMFPWTVPF